MNCVCVRSSAREKIKRQCKTSYSSKVRSKAHQVIEMLETKDLLRVLGNLGRDLSAGLYLYVVEFCDKPYLIQT